MAFCCTSFRMALIVILSAAGYILVAEAPTVAVAIAGVVCTALSSGLGEASLLSYMAFYKNKYANCINFL